MRKSLIVVAIALTGATVADPCGAWTAGERGDRVGIEKPFAPCPYRVRHGRPVRLCAHAVAHGAPAPYVAPPRVEASPPTNNYPRHYFSRW